MSKEVNLAKATLPISALSVVIGGAAWLTSVREKVVNLEEKLIQTRLSVDKLERELKAFETNTAFQIKTQGETVARIDGKLDLIVGALNGIEKRVNMMARDMNNRR